MINAVSHHGIFVLDQDRALDFYVGTLGMEVSADVDLGVMRWLTVRAPGDDHHVLLEVPGPPAHDPQTTEHVRELLSKGAFGLAFVLGVDDARATHATFRERGVEVTQDPVEMPYGVDFGIRDPFGNQIRVTQPVAASNEEIQRGFDRMATEQA